MYFPISSWFPAFVITLVVEIPIVAVLVRRWERDAIRLGIIIVVANLATHPVVWYVISQILSVGTPAYTLAAEIWAVAVETAIYWAAIRGLPVRRALVVAAVANVTSWFVGRAIGGVWPELFS